ncbi:MAG: ABC transporter ATP-binding protein [Geminicoccaceae bacterium]|nr:ABC transporter ATP-binding protein [Geminicoccaceae bacterium]
MTRPFLDIKGIRKTFGPVVAVEDVTLEVAKGEFLTFLGPSGSGKSTTLYAIAGFQPPTSGEVLLDGRSLLAVPSHKRNIGMVFQRYTLFPHLSVAENVAFPLRVRRRKDAEIDAKVARMLALVRLDGMGGRMPGQLSGGQQQRVALARALAYDPPVLLMDEPLSALDKKLREKIQLEIRRIHKETGVTILYVTHDQEEALRLSDRIAVFNRGRIEQTGTGRDLYENPATGFVAGFIGSSNFLPAEMERGEGDAAAVRLPDGTRLTGVRMHQRLGAGESCALMVRPERLRLETASTGGVPVRIDDVTYLGDSLHFLVQAPWRQQIGVRMPIASGIDAGLTSGTEARLVWPASAGHLFAGAS